jgi:hypothetical protein
MNPVQTDLVSPEEADKQGAQAPPVALVLSLMEKFHVPSSVHCSNVRSFRKENQMFICDKVVVNKPLSFGQELVLVQSTAVLSGFYNPAPEILCAAYSVPVLDKAWRVTVGVTIDPYVASPSVIHYGGLVLHLISEIEKPS